MKSVSETVEKIKQFLQPKPSDNPDDPDEPYAMVGARIRPRPPLGSSSVAVQPEP